MKRLLVLLLLLIPSIVHSQNQNIYVDGQGWRSAKGDGNGVQFFTERYPGVFTSLTVASNQSITAGSTFTTPAFPNPFGGEIWFRFLQPTAQAGSTIYLKFRGSSDGITFPFLNNGLVAAGSMTLIDTLQVVSTVANVSPGQWLPLKTRNGAPVILPWVQADIVNPTGTGFTASATLELAARRN